MRALAVILLVLEGCASQSSSPTPPEDAGATCPSDLPPSCPTPTPSYDGEVSGIIQRRCWQCHADGGIAASSDDFSTYDAVFEQRSAVLNQVYSCTMPPSYAPQPTPEERAALLGWLVCKAPKN